jgi:hypothetical protein
MRDHICPTGSAMFLCLRARIRATSHLRLQVPMIFPQPVS